MSIIPTITCRKCGQKYSGLLRQCPHCGARRQAASQRAASGSDSVRRGTPAAARASSNAVWQLAFGLVLLAVVILSVIVLIVTSLNDREAKADPNSRDNLVAPPSISLPVSGSPGVNDPNAVSEVTPSPTPTPTVGPTSLSVYYATSPLASTGFTHIVGQDLTLTATVYPIDITASVQWRSTDTSVFTVASSGNSGTVRGVAPGSATLIVSCGDLQLEYPVIIKEHW